MKVFCWDFDGTLVSSRSLWSRSALDALNAVLPGSGDGLLENIRALMNPRFPWNAPDADYTACLGEKWWALMEEHYRQVYTQCGIAPETAKMAAKRVRPMLKRTDRYLLYEDAIPTLQALKERGMANLLLSNNYPDLVEVLEALGLLPYFDRLVISAQIGYNKPRPEIFALAKANYPDAEFYMIGDNVIADILGGKRSGMTTVLVHQGYSEQADYCFDELRSVLSLL